MAAAELHNAEIDGDETIRAGRARALAAARAIQRGAAVVEADEDELVYEITFDIPDEGLLQVPVGEDRDDTSSPVIALDNDKNHGGIQDVHCYPTQLAGVWSAINLTTHTHHEQRSYNSERCERKGVHSRRVAWHV